MLRRLFKQFVYGLFYLAILAAIIVGVYFIWRPAATCFDDRQNQDEEGIDCGGPCVSCVIKNLIPLKVLPMQFFPASGDKTLGATVLAQIENLNTTYGVARGDYRLALYDAAGQEIYTLAGASVVAPGEKKTLLFPALEAPFARVNRGELVFASIDWCAAEDWPKLDVRAEITKTQFFNQQAIVGGRLMNDGPAIIGHVKINILLFNKKGLAINGSQTILEDVAPFSARDFKIFVPLMASSPEDFDLNKAQIFLDAAP